jgi:L,D-transpeptidase catalytic domain
VVMRLRAIVGLVALLAAACAAPDPVRSGPVLTESLQRVAPRDDAPSWDPAPHEVRPIWRGYQATRTEPGILAAMVREPVDIFAEPGAEEPALTVERTTILGTITVLGVVGEPVDGWVEVMLPTRPNGSTGWVRTEEVSLYVADSRIVVDLSGRELRYLVDGVEVLSTPVGVGSRYNETPLGEFFVTDNVTLANPNSPWGPHALGLSARSETITSYNGGDGIIGIHGTNNPSSIGGNISLGCVRLPNDMITLLHEMVPLGTRVEINA